MNTQPLRVIDPDTILCLLEDDEPRSTSELAAACGTTTKAMSTRLSQLAQARRIRRSNTTGKWYRVVAADAPAPVLRPEAVLHQLEFAPKSELVLSEALHVAIPALRLTLAAMAEAGQVKPIGKLTHLRWARADWGADQPRTGRPQKRSTPADPGARMAQGSTSGYLADAAFTNLTRKPATPPPVDADGVSWWVPVADPTLPRDAFRTAAAKRDAEMRETSTAWRSPRPVGSVTLN